MQCIQNTDIVSPQTYQTWCRCCTKGRYVDAFSRNEGQDTDTPVTENPSVVAFVDEMKELALDALNIFCPLQLGRSWESVTPED